MARRLIVAILIAATGLLSGPAVIDFVVTDAAAQARRAEPDNRNFFQRLFGPRRREVRRPPAEVQAPKAQPRKRRQAEPAPVAVAKAEPKAPDARKVLVVGDFVAGGLAWGLEQAFADEPKLLVVDKAEASSGLVRADYYDWNEALPGLLNETQPDLVVFVIGANDRQELRSGPIRSAVRSDAWVATYTQRIEGIAETLKVYGRPFFWVGAAPMRATSASSDMAYLNTLYKPRVEDAGGHFVDIWNGFANEDGRYVTSGPDVEGQVRQLRTGDGINFTRAGRLKLAFYVERDIRRQTGFGSGGIDLLATVTQGNQIEIAPDGTKLLVGPIISLSDPLPGSNELAGIGVPNRPTDDSPQFKLIVRGEAPSLVPGRIDDFSWPPRPAEGLLPDEPLAQATGVPVPVARPESVPN